MKSLRSQLSRSLGIGLMMLLLPFVLPAQIGGTGIFKSLNTPISSRLAALAGTPISVLDDDPALGFANPALLNPLMNMKLSASYINYISDITFGNILYTQHSDTLKTTFSVGLNHVNYGDFIRADVNGTQNGTFSGRDYTFFVGAGRSYKRIHYGLTAKYVISQLDVYNASGLCFDAGGAYNSKDSNFTTALLFRNVGWEISAYNIGHEPLPFEIQAAVAFKPKHAPIRLHILLHDLQMLDLTYNNPTKQVQNDFSNQPVDQSIPFSEKIFRHFNFAGEFLLGKFLRAQIGYNHMIRKELSLAQLSGSNGFSFGVGIRTKFFNFSYGLVQLHAAGSSSTFTLGLNINQFRGKPVPPSS